MGTAPLSRPPLTRDAIVAEARSLIVREGLDAVSFRRIAQRLGVTAPALYAHVADKGDLLRAVAAGELDTLLAQFEPGDGDVVERLRTYCRAYLRYAVANPALYRTLFLFPPWGDEAASGYAPGELRLPLPRDRFEVPYRAVVAGIEQGRLRPGPPLAVLLTLWTAMHGLADVLLLGLPTDPEGREAFATRFVDTVVEGVRAPG